jgi:hypothetical protein
MVPTFVPMTLGDIFEKTFSLFGKTFVRNLMIALVFLVVPIVVMVMSADIFYNSIADMQENLVQGQAGGGLETVTSMIETFSFFGFAILLLMVCGLFAEITISIVVSQELLGQPISFNDALNETFQQKWRYGIGQGLLKFFILIGGMVIAGIVMAILSAFSQILGGLVMILSILVLIPVLFYIIFKWFFSLTAVAVSDLGVTDSLRKSWNLVDGYWWRTFGIILLLGIIAQLIVSIISLPVTFAFMWDFYQRMFASFGETGGNFNPETSRQLLRDMGLGVGISIGVSSLISMLITPVYTVVLYYDLRARNSDFPRSKETETLDDQSPEPIDLGMM